VFLTLCIFISKFSKCCNIISVDVVKKRVWEIFSHLFFTPFLI